MDIYIALVHHPVKNRRGETVATAVTNLDIHDLARAGRTYGVAAYYLVSPVAQQLSLVERIVEHWQRGEGAVFNPIRAQAFDGVRVAKTTDEVVQDIAAETGAEPLTVVTGAWIEDQQRDIISYEALRERLRGEEGSVLLLFGTGWGLTEDYIQGCDLRLPAVRAVEGRRGYNHLSVRSAASIILDRLLGDR